MPKVKFYLQDTCVGSLGFVVTPKIGDIVVIPNGQGQEQGYTVLQSIYVLDRKHNADCEVKIQVAKVGM